jgi:hypothetical protein
VLDHVAFSIESNTRFNCFMVECLLIQLYKVELTALHIRLYELRQYTLLTPVQLTHTHTHMRSVHVLEKTENNRRQQCSQNACAVKLEKGVSILSKFLFHMKIAYYTNTGHPVGCCRFRWKHRQTSNCVTRHHTWPIQPLCTLSYTIT